MGTSASANDKFHSGGALPMVDPTTRCVGGYGDIVVALRTNMHKARVSASLSLNERLEVAVFGHGGRDTNCWLALVEAAALDETLHTSEKNEARYTGHALKSL